VSRYVSFRDFDWVLFGLVLLIASIGVWQIASAGHNTKFDGVYVKQLYWLAIGVAVMFIASLVSYQMLLENVHWMWIAGVLSLVAVLIFGVEIFGAKRWIRLPGGQHFQPSEWMKLVLILAVAKYFADARHRETTWGDIFKLGLIAGVPFLLVLKQPDLGTSLTYVPIALTALFLGGLRFKQAMVMLLGLALLMPVVWMYGLKPYQKARLVSFRHPELDPKGSGYQVQQSLIAVGSGGVWGRGWRKGSQTQGEFLPVTHTDFAFATFAEEQGFVGASGLLLLYFLVLMRLIHNAQTAPDRAGSFVVMGLVGVLAFHILVNVGMVVGFMPVTGIPLPLISYGGSSVVFIFIALGIVMNVRMRRFVN
jgi:rod shape determining protein RodA